MTTIPSFFFLAHQRLNVIAVLAISALALSACGGGDDTIAPPVLAPVV